MDAIDYDLLVFQTDMYLPDAFDSDHSLKFFEIKPSKQQIWDFTLLSCFLNSFPSFFKNKRSPFQVDFSNQSYNARFLFKDSDSSFEIRIGNSITVIGNLSFLKTFFTRQSQNLFSCLRKWYKFRSHPVFQEHIYYNYSITGISNETECLLFHKPLLFCLKDNFTPIFRFFAKNIQKVGLPETHDTFSIQEYISLFSKRKENCFNTLDLLKENLKGLLYLTIQKSQIRHHLAKVEFNGEQYYIIKGLYILPFSQSILTKNENSIDGIITDTTWRILPNYVTSIMMASSKNTGIPISFSFGHSEDKEIYELHFDGFERFTTVKLNSFVFESDQGTALKAVFKDKKIKYFICLRHLLVNLKFNQISFAIRNILFCTSIDELDRAFEFYSKMFSEIKEPQMQKKRDGLLEKVGLMFHDYQIMICNQERWEQVSLNERQKFKMPSTTNALESCHGHLNEKTKRRKNFFQSIFKIAQHLIQKCTSIEKSIQHNYQFAIKKNN